MREETLRFESYDLNASGFVRTSSVLRRMQQAARDDLKSFGITYEDMREKNMAFVLSRMSLSFQRPIRGERDLILRTAPLPTHGATFPRTFSISDEVGVCVRGMSLWALLDFEKRSLLRPSALWAEIPTSTDLSEGLSCERIIRPADAKPDLSDERRVYASLLDQNNHLNNCNYADLATDLLPEGAGEVKEIHLSFQHEARLGEVLRIEGYHTDGAYLISGTFRDREESCFLCKIKLFEE